MLAGRSMAMKARIARREERQRIAERQTLRPIRYSLSSYTSSDHFERRLRGPLPDAFAASGEAELADLRAALVGQGDVDQAHGFFRSAAPRARDAGDAYAERRRGALAD